LEGISKSLSINVEANMNYTTRVHIGFIGFCLAIFLSTGALSALAQATAGTLPTEIIDVRSPRCPIMGGTPQESIAILYEGKIYHFCCGGCIQNFKKDPTAAIANLVDAKNVRLKVLNVNGECPVTGDPAKADVVAVRGNTVTFYCCPDCIAKDKAAGGSDKPGANAQVPGAGMGGCH
jgi:YHS domain-containing protein